MWFNSRIKWLSKSFVVLEVKLRLLLLSPIGIEENRAVVLPGVKCLLLMVLRQVTRCCTSVVSVVTISSNQQDMEKNRIDINVLPFILTVMFL